MVVFIWLGLSSSKRKNVDLRTFIKEVIRQIQVGVDDANIRNANLEGIELDIAVDYEKEFIRVAESTDDNSTRIKIYIKFHW